MDNNPENERERVGGRLVIYAEIYEEEDPGDVPLEEPIEMEADDGDVESAEEEHFDITLAATHSYMGSELQEVSGRNVLEAGWRGVLPSTLYHGCVFPGETVPLLLLDVEDAAIIANTLKKDRLFALLCPVANGEEWDGFGVVCEVYEASSAAPARYKARALHRCRAARPLPALQLHAFRNKMRPLEVEVLAEVTLADPLRPARLASLDAQRHGDRLRDRRVRSLDALVTPWPLFVFDIFNFGRMRDIIKDYFKTMNLERMVPEEPVSLSFWAARNLTLEERDRLALFSVDNTLQRLHMACRFISRTSVVCCSGCGVELARRDHVIAMSSDGVHSTYTNPDGYMHDIVTVTRAENTQASGRGSAEYSWFPGYRWTCVVCARCVAHVGWRFDALRRNLRPAQFYALCRNYAAPQEERDNADPPPPPPPQPPGAGEGGALPLALHIPRLQFRLGW